MICRSFCRESCIPLCCLRIIPIATGLFVLSRPLHSTTVNAVVRKHLADVPGSKGQRAHSQTCQTSQSTHAGLLNILRSCCILLHKHNGSATQKLSTKRASL